MADVLNELTKLSETLQSRNTTLPKADTLLNAYTKHIKSVITSPEEHSILTQQAEKAMAFQQVELREGKSPEKGKIGKRKNSAIAYNRL